MIFIGIGSNLPSESLGSSLSICEESLNLMGQAGMKIRLKSAWYETAPIPASAQPNFINGVICVETALISLDLLAVLQAIETRMGRVRSIPNAARVIDLDLLAYNDDIVATKHLTLPHPKLTERAFVAQPIAEIAPDWCHPLTGVSIKKILSDLSDQEITRISA